MLDLKPSNMLLELEDPETVVVKYLERTTPRSQDGEGNADGSPLREVLPTSLISKQEKVHVKLIDFGVGK
jgi:serine/threonine-protein kinase SRPK3